MGIKTTRSGVKSVNDKEKSKRKIFLKISLFLHRGKSNLLGCQSSTKSSKRRKRRRKQVMKTSAVEFYLYFYSKRDPVVARGLWTFITAEKACFFSMILVLFLPTCFYSNFAENFSKDRVFFRFCESQIVYEGCPNYGHFDSLALVDFWACFFVCFCYFDEVSVVNGK